MNVVPVTPRRLDDLANLFDSNGATRGCWCMFFISPRKEYDHGRRGGNRQRFEELVQAADPPMGLLAYRGDRAVGWCATGPRSRYPNTISSRATILKGRDPVEDDDVWLVPCFFVRVGERRQGTTQALLEAAVELARRYGAKAIEGFPLSDDHPRSPDDYLGREHRFAACGFECVARPTPRRVIMRRELRGDLPSPRGRA